MAEVAISGKLEENRKLCIIGCMLEVSGQLSVNLHGSSECYL